MINMKIENGRRLILDQSTEDGVIHAYTEKDNYTDREFYQMIPPEDLVTILNLYRWCMRNAVSLDEVTMETMERYRESKE